MGATRLLRRGRALPAARAVALPACAQDDGAGAAPRGVAGRRRAPASASVDVNRDALLPVRRASSASSPSTASSVYETDLQTARASLFYPGEGADPGPEPRVRHLRRAVPAGVQAGPRRVPLLQVPADGARRRQQARRRHRRRRDARQADRPDLRRRRSVPSPTRPPTARAPPTQMSATCACSACPASALTSVLPIEELQGRPHRAARSSSATSRTDQRIDAGALVVDRRGEALRRRAWSAASCRSARIVSTSTATDDGHGKRTADRRHRGERRHRRRVPGADHRGRPRARLAQRPRTDQAAGPAGGQPAARRRSACGSACSTTRRPPTTAPGWPAAQAPGVLVEVTTRADGAAARARARSATSTSTATYVGHDPARHDRRARPAPTTFDDEVDRRRSSTRRSTCPSTRGFVPTDAGRRRHRRRRRRATPPPADGSRRRRRRRSSSSGASSTPSADGSGCSTSPSAFAVLGLCLVPRLTLPARLPGVRS